MLVAAGELGVAAAALLPLDIATRDVVAFDTCRTDRLGHGSPAMRRA